MNLKIVFLLGLRYLKSKKYKNAPSITSILCFLGIFIGIISMIVVSSIMNGFQDEFTRQVIGIEPHIELYKYKNSIHSSKEIQKSLENLKSNNQILSINESFSNESMLTYENINNILMTKGVSYEVMKSKKVKFNNNFSKVEFDDYGIIIGKALLERLSCSIGDFVDIIVPKFSDTIFGAIPIIKQFKIIGTFESGIYQYDNNIGFISIESAKNLFNLKQDQSNIEIYLKNPNNVDSIHKIINKDKNLEKSYYLTNWKLSNSAIINGLNMQKNVLILILSIFVMIAILGITTNLILLVNDKIKNIAILRSMGISKLEIGASFLVTSSLISFFGILFGNLFGVIIAKNIDKIRIFFENMFDVVIIDQNLYLLSFLPSKIDFYGNIKLSLLAFIASIFASLIPSMKAAKMNISELLKM